MARKMIAVLLILCSVFANACSEESIDSLLEDVFMQDVYYGDVYENDWLGIRVSLPGWTFRTKEDIDNENSNELWDYIAEQEDCTKFRVIMQASSENKLSKFSVHLLFTDSLQTAALVEKEMKFYRIVYEDLYHIGSCQSAYERIEVDGREADIIWNTISNKGKNMQAAFVLFPIGDYWVRIYMLDSDQDTIKELVSAVTWL